jgi:hypothetical protein
MYACKHESRQVSVICHIYLMLLLEEDSDLFLGIEGVAAELGDIVNHIMDADSKENTGGYAT